MKLRKINNIINTITVKSFWGNVTKIEVNTPIVPLNFTDIYEYYIEAKLLLRKVNGVIVAHAIGIKAKMTYEILGGEHVVSHTHLLEIVSMISGFSVELIVSNTRQEECVCCRNLVMWHYKKMTDMNNTKITLAEIGSYFGKDHATVIYSLNDINADDKYKKPFQIEYKKAFVSHMKNIYDNY